LQFENLCFLIYIFSNQLKYTDFKLDNASVIANSYDRHLNISLNFRVFLKRDIHENNLGASKLILYVHTADS
jgi:hypothetical protein